MRVTNIFSPVLTVGATGSFPLIADNGGFIIIINESPANLNFTFPDGSTMYIASYDRRKICFTGQTQQPSGTVSWVVQSIPLELVLLANQVVTETYASGEKSPEVYPTPLFRQLRAFS